VNVYFADFTRRDHRLSQTDVGGFDAMHAFGRRKAKDGRFADVCFHRRGRERPVFYDDVRSRMRRRNDRQTA